MRTCSKDRPSEGQNVRFQRDTLAYFGHGWEQGVYVKPASKGWHWVKTLSGEKFLVPSRRVRLFEED